MKKLGLYKNIYCTDSAVLILYWSSAGNGATYKVKLNWWNVVSDDRNRWFDMGVKETLYIPKEKWEREWQLIG